MKIFRMIYNPYHVRTTLAMQSMDGRWENVGDDSLLAPVFNMRLQKWLYPRKNSSWCGFFKELQEILGEKTFIIQFSGTEEDFEEISAEAKRFNSDDAKAVSVEVASDCDSVSFGSTKTLSFFCDIVQKARSEDYYNMISERIRHFFETAFLTIESTGRIVDVKDLKDEMLTEIFGPTCWDMVLFHFNLGDIDDRGVRTNVFKISNRMKSLERYEIERFAFVCGYDYLHVTASHAEYQAKAFLREMGITEDIGLVLKSKGTSLESDSPGEGTDEVKKIMDAYSKRYANPIRLQKSRQCLIHLLHTNGMESHCRPLLDSHGNGHDLVKESFEGAGGYEDDHFYSRLQTWDASKELDELVKECYGYYINTFNRMLKTMENPETGIPLSDDDMEVFQNRVCDILSNCLVNGSNRFCERLEENVWFKEYKWFEAACNVEKDISNGEGSQGFRRVCQPNELHWEDSLTKLRDSIQNLYTANRSISVRELLQLSYPQALKIYGVWLSEFKTAILRDFEDFKKRLKGKCSRSMEQVAHGIQQDAKNIENAAQWLQNIVDLMNKHLDF